MSTSPVLDAYYRLSIHLPSFDFPSAAFFNSTYLSLFIQNRVSNSLVHKPYLGMGKLDFVNVLNYSHSIPSSSSVIFIISQLRYWRGIKAEGEEFRWLENSFTREKLRFKTKQYLHYFPCFPLPVKLHGRRHCPMACIKATFILSQVRAKMMAFLCGTACCCCLSGF